jgi:hypothetical protein
MVPMPVSSCARLSGSFPEPTAPSPSAREHWLETPPRWAGLLLAAVSLVACSRDAHAVRLPSDPGTDVYRITCRSAIEPCREKASTLCHGEYEVLENAGAPLEPPRVSSAPGPRSTGSRYQRPDWVGEMVVACGAPERTAGEPAPAAGEVSSPASGASAPLALAPDQLCIPGVTQLCLGPAACRGAQACLADGRGYGRCDCGTASANDAGSRAD